MTFKFVGAKYPYLMMMALAPASDIDEVIANRFEIAKEFAAIDGVDYADIRIVATHDGIWHCDDLAGVVAWRPLSPTRQSPSSSLLPIVVVRTRDIRVMEKCDVRVDVGGRYDPTAGDFDHHWARPEELARPNGVPYASAGLVWKAIGTDRCAFAGRGEKIANIVDDKIIQAIDAHDVKYTAMHSQDPYAADATPRYGFSEFIASLNDNSSGQLKGDLPGFLVACHLAGVAIDQVMLQECRKALAEDIVEGAINGTTRTGIMTLGTFIHWVDALLANPAGNDVKLVIFEDQTSGTFRLQTVPQKHGSKTPRCPLPQAWWGKDAATITEECARRGHVIAADDVIFCHQTGFIAGAKSWDAAMAMAKAALAAAEEEEIASRMVTEAEELKTLAADEAAGVAAKKS